MIGIFINSLVIGYSGAVMPGSLLTYAIDKSIKRGAKSGLLISIGHSVLEFILVLLILFGLGNFLKTMPAQTTIGILGGGFLSFFGIGMLLDVYRGKLSVNFSDEGNSRFGNLVLGGAVISASNPYFIIWWAGVGLSLIMGAYESFGILGVVFFYLGHIIADISWYCFISILVSRTRGFISLFVYKIIVSVLGVTLIGFGIIFIYGSLNNIIKYII